MSNFNSTDERAENLVRWQILMSGQVQGVGFRPFIYKLAQEQRLSGTVCNTSDGVCLEIQGQAFALRDFLDALKNSLPPLAVLTSCTSKEIEILPLEYDFKILASHGKNAHNVLISPDTALCCDCEKDMSEPANRRHLYAFTNCTNCGPRYTITKSIPYDRINTSMSCFKLCQACQQEYDNPLDRRFHAQPNACPQCGPRLRFLENETTQEQIDAIDVFNTVDSELALPLAARALLNKKILGIKGLGGFHLVCMAFDTERIALLRLRKHRPHKPFAIMVKNIKIAEQIAHISKAQATLLSGLEKPIVLCNRKPILPEILAPDSDTIGIMLPYTPLHAALFEHLEAEQAFLKNSEPLALVMTSGNAGGEPICLGNREGLERLRPLVDGFLLHNRDILVRIDDSVCKVDDNNDTFFFRRARGYVPRPICMSSAIKHAPSILGMGAELKNCLCLTRGQDAFLSQHIGDLQNAETLQFYHEVLQHLQDLLQVKPKLIVHDLHPDFLSTHAAKKYAAELGIECIPLQHHVAHAFAVLAEHKHTDPCLALILDGTGLGEDGTIWGGELFYIHPLTTEYKRLGRLSPFALVGGEKAIQEPWRIAVALAQDTEFEDELFSQFRNSAMLMEMLKKNINCAHTSSSGRLFDAVSAALSLCTHISYEGQAAIRLEAAQKSSDIDSSAQSSFDFELATSCQAQKNNDLWELPSKEIFTHILRLAKKHTVPHAARAFHALLSAGFAHMAKQASKDYHLKNIIINGGVMQNATMLKHMRHDLQKLGFNVLTPKNIPPSDAGIGLGQAYFGALRTCAK